MKFARTHKWVTYLLATVAVAPVIFSGEIGIPAVVLFTGLGVAGWFLEPPLTWHPRFRKAVNALILITFAVQLTRVLLGQSMAHVGMEFALVLLGIKLCSRGWSGDYQQIVVLSFLQLVAATVAIVDFAYAAGFVLFVILVSPALTLVHLRTEMEKRFEPNADQNKHEMLYRLYNSRRIISPGFLMSAGFLSGPVLAMTIVLFVLFPRVGIGLLGRMPTDQASVGFGDQLTIGDIDLIRRDDAVLMRIEPLDDQSRRSVHLNLYLRGVVFDTYENDIWKHTETRWTALKGRRGRYVLDNVSMDRAVLSGYEILLESTEPALLFLPKGTGQLGTYPRMRNGRMRSLKLEGNGLGMVRYEDHAKVGLRYRVYLTGTTAHGVGPDGEIHYLQLPENSAQLAQLARTLSGEGTNWERATRLTRSLRERYRYSTELSSDSRNALETTPLERFLFARRSGTCEHFATALTLMLRAVDIPARTAAGFAGADWNPLGGYYTVRKRSAHSWTEAYIDGAWQTLDATPAATGRAVWRPPSQLALVLDTLRMRWHKYVIGYDATHQLQFAARLRQLWRGSNADFEWRSGLSGWLWGFGTLVILVGAIWIVRRRMAGPKHPASGQPRSRPRRRQLSRATTLIRRLDRKLARLGCARSPRITPLDHVHSLASQKLPVVEWVLPIVERYNQVRFGYASFEPGEFDRLVRTIRRLDRKATRGIVSGPA